MGFISDVTISQHIANIFRFMSVTMWLFLLPPSLSYEIEEYLVLIIYLFMGFFRNIKLLIKRIKKQCNLVECNVESVVCQHIVLAPIYAYSLILFMHHLDHNIFIISHL